MVCENEMKYKLQKKNKMKYILQRRKMSNIDLKALRDKSSLLRNETQALKLIHFYLEMS